IKMKTNQFIMVACACCLMLWACRKDMTGTELNAIDANSVTNSSRSSDIPSVPVNLRLDPTFEQTPFTARLTWDAAENVDVLVYRGTSTQIETVVSANSLKLFGRWQY